MTTPAVRIAPSILSADFAALGEAVKAAEAGGADLIHVDVMDGHFVPNLTIGPPVVRALKRVATVPLDVHLMIENADRCLDDFIDGGAAILTVHAEAVPHLHRAVWHIKHRGAQAGVAINPATPVEALSAIIQDLDLVLVMSVNPGFGGQTFIPHSVPKIRRVRDLIRHSGSRAAIEVDGGVEQHNAAAVVEAGASILVAGSAIFHTSDPAAATRALREAAARAKSSPGESAADDSTARRETRSKSRGTPTPR